MGVLIALVALYWTFLFFMQRRFMYPAPAISGFDSIPPESAQQVWLEGTAGSTEAWLLPPLTKSEPHPLLIFGHGNAELIEYWPEAFDEPRRWGIAVLLVEYPGYGPSKGSPSEESIGVTFRAAYDWAIEQDDVDANRIIGYGRSLGGGAVAGLSRDRNLAAMILESTFTSTRPFANRMGAPGFLVRDLFDNVAAVKAYKGPLIVLHGSHDEIIPVEHGIRLANAGGVTLNELPCGHNDCPPTWPLIRPFLIESQIVKTGN